MGACTRRVLGFTALVALVQHAGCAHVRPLEGGAADQSPPQLALSLPADSSRGTGRTPILELQFDETLNATPAASAVRTYPSQPRPEVRARGTRIEIRYRDSLPPDTTFAIVIGEGLEDAAGRGNELASEIWLVFATGDSLRGGAVFGRVRAKGKPEPQAAVRFEPLAAISDSIDSLRVRKPGIRPRPVVAAADAEGLFRLLALPSGKPFVLRAFVDRNHNLDVDDDELAAAYPETLQLRDGEALRGLEWNLVDPKEPGTIQGVAFNRTTVAGRIAVSLQPVDLPPDTTQLGADDSTRHDSLGVRTAVDSAAARAEMDSVAAPAAIDSIGPDSLRISPAGVWEPAYAALGAWEASRRPRGSMETPTVYASPRGDYSLRVRPGRHRLIAFIDASGDSLPGTYIAADSLHREWEPLWVGGILEVAPAAEIRPRSIDIETPP